MLRLCAIFRFFMMAFINTILDRYVWSRLMQLLRHASPTHSFSDIDFMQMIASCASCLIVTVYCSLANSLVITAVGGGTEVIPFLTGRFLQPGLAALHTHRLLLANMWYPACSVRRVAYFLHIFGSVFICHPALLASNPLQYSGQHLSSLVLWLCAAVSTS